MKTSSNTRVQGNLNSSLDKLITYPGTSPVLTWDGIDEYVVQPAEQYCNLHYGHTTILTQEDLLNYLGEFSWDPSDAEFRQGVVNWVLDNQEEWVSENQ